MKEIASFECWICGKIYDTQSEAKECEAKGLILPYFKIGDVAKYTVCAGSDRDGGYYNTYTGQILDILFRMPTQGVGQRRPCLDHKYAVYYLVCSNKEHNHGFFDEKSVVLLQTISTIKVVSEGNMHFKDGSNDRLSCFDNNPSKIGRTVTATWADYAKSIVQQNPQLQDRLKAFTVELKKLGCID